MEDNAAISPIKLNSTMDAVVNSTPPTIGINEAYIALEVTTVIIDTAC